MHFKVQNLKKIVLTSQLEFESLLRVEFKMQQYVSEGRELLPTFDYTDISDKMPQSMIWTVYSSVFQFNLTT